MRKLSWTITLGLIALASVGISPGRAVAQGDGKLIADSFKIDGTTLSWTFKVSPTGATLPGGWTRKWEVLQGGQVVSTGTFDPNMLNRQQQYAFDLARGTSLQLRILEDSEGGRRRGLYPTVALDARGPILKVDLKIVESFGKRKLTGAIRNHQDRNYQSHPSRTYKLSYVASNDISGTKEDSQSVAIPNIQAGGAVPVELEVPPWYLNETVAIDGKLELKGTASDSTATAKWDWGPRESLRYVQIVAGPPKKLVIGLANLSSVPSGGIDLKISFTPQGGNSRDLGTLKSQFMLPGTIKPFEFTPTFAIPNGPGTLWVTIPPPSRPKPAGPYRQQRELQMSVEIP